MQTKLCPKCGRVSPEDASKCECGYSFEHGDHPDDGGRRDALAQWLGVGRLNVRAFAMAGGLLWGFGVLLLTWWVILFEGSTGEVTVIGKIYRGYSISPIGSLVGFAWGLVDGLISGAIFAWLYNMLVLLWSRSSRTRF